MRGHRILAMARKEIIQILRDSRSLAIVVLMPPILMLMFGYGVSLDTKGIPLYAFDREGSQQSQDLLKRFQSSQYFKVLGTVDNYPALLRAIDDGNCRIAIVIPPDFSRKLNAGGPVSVQALVDGIDDNTANLSFGYSETVVRGFSSDVQLDWTRRRGLSAAPRPSTFLLSSFLFLTVVLATGYLISIIAKTQLAASQTALVSTFLPAFLLSGFIYPIDQMPPVVRAITRVIPARYYVDMTKRIFLKAGSIPVLRQDLTDLLILAAVVGILATRAFQKKLD